MIFNCVTFFLVPPIAGYFGQTLANKYPKYAFVIGVAAMAIVTLIINIKIVAKG